MPSLLSADALIALATLTLMEIVLGIDNIVFIAILVAKLPASQRELARRLGITLALGIRILLLLAISWIMGLTEPLITVRDRDVTSSCWAAACSSCSRRRARSTRRSRGHPTKWRVPGRAPSSAGSCCRSF